MIEELKKRILVLDGAMGTAIQSYGLSTEDFKGHIGCNEILNLTRPDVIREIHTRYLEAGADILETNTFNCSSVSLEEYGLGDKAYLLSKMGGELAKEVARGYEERKGRRIFVAGSVGPTSKSTSISTDISFDDLKRAYREQVAGLVDGGVDLILVETIFDGLNAKTALLAIEELFEERGIKLPVMVSATVDKRGHIFSGQSIESLIVSLDRDFIISFGFNCSFGAEDLVPLTEKLGKFTDKYVSLYPNAGLPDENGEYMETAELTLSFLRKLIDDGGINIVGGCCGTTFSHVEAIAEAVKGKKPRIPKGTFLEDSYFAGNEIFPIKNRFLKVGERNNVAGSKIFKKVIEEGNYLKGVEIARNQILSGAHILDINLDDGLLNSPKEMETFVRLLQNDPLISKIPLMVDSSEFDTIHRALKNIPGKAIVNSLSLKEGEKEFIRKAKIVKSHGAAIIVMAFDEVGQGVDCKRKVEIAKRAHRILKDIGFKDRDIYFDLNILTIGTGDSRDRYNGIEFLEAVKEIKRNFPGVGISGGLSNLSFAYRGNNPLRAAIHGIFLEMAENAGMDMAILNPAEKMPDLSFSQREIITKLILGEIERIPDEMIESFCAVKRIEPIKIETVQDRIDSALIQGGSSTFEEDIKEVLRSYTPIEVIQIVLMKGLEKVGKLFEKGEIYLPQVIRSAGVMNTAVDILLPLLEKGERTSARGRILIATVEGDIHDIGKNIVGTVLKCNGFEIIDLGVMVSKERIMEAVEEHRPDIVGLSGLISPSLKEMEKVLTLFHKENLEIPVFIGGAAASKLHTAVKLEPLYSGKTIYVSDASSTVPVASALCSSQRGAHLEKLMREYEQIRAVYWKEQEEKKARTYEKQRISLGDVVLPKEVGKRYLEISLNELESLVNWDLLLHNLKVKNSGKEKEILEEAKSLYETMGKKGYRARCAYGIFPCIKDRDEILVQGEKEYKIPMARGIYREKSCSLSDFFQSEDYLGAFVISIDGKLDERDGYLKILENLIAMRVAEAASEYLQRYVDKNIWPVSIRPAVGYSSLPDHSLKKEIFDLVGGQNTGALLSKTYSIIPSYSVCGIYISNPKSFYFNLE